MPPSLLPLSPLRHSPSRRHKAYSPYLQSAPHFHRKCGALFGIVGARRGMFSFDTKREPEKCAFCGVTFCLLSACKDAPLGQRQGGVFRVPPPYLWTPPTPQQQRRRPPPAAETGRSCWGSGQQDASAAQGTKRMLGAATRFQGLHALDNPKEEVEAQKS